MTSVMTPILLYRISLLYLLLPVIIFFAGWLHPMFSFPFFGLCVYVSYYQRYKSDKTRKIPYKILWISIGVALIWCYLGGLSGLYYQSDDYHFRNAVLRDLIYHSWPVYFKTFDAAMVYYFGHWMFAALIGKAALSVGLSDTTVWLLANITLYLWSAAGVALIIAHLYVYWQPSRIKSFIGLILLFIFFSGIDVIGTFYLKVLSEHIEWWASFLQYSSLTTCLFWVFNQTIAPWLIIMMLITQKRIQDMALLGVLCFFYAPLPAVGLLPFLLLWSVQALLRQKHFFLFLKQALSPQNIGAACFCLPLFYLFLSVNQTIREEQNALRWALTYDGMFKTYAIFLFLEGGFLILLLMKSFYRNPTFYVTAISFVLIPLLRIGTASNDFAMRVSIPTLFLLMLFTGKALTTRTLPKIRKTAVLICLLVGSVTPAIEFGRGFYHVYQEKRLILPADDIRSFETYRGQAVYKNFFVLNPGQTLFFSTFTRIKPPQRK